MTRNHEVLTVRNLTTKLKLGDTLFPVISDLNFTLKRGQTVALVGESGCGKSMAALSILGILPKPPAQQPEGEVIYKGENLLTFSETRMRKIRGKQIAMIFQDPLSALNPVFPIGSQMLEVTQTHLLLDEEVGIDLILKALHDVHLENPKQLLHAYPHQLSGGMLQRVMIAMALICSPDVLIADEPTTALDVTIQSQILSLLREIQKNKGMAILLITHDMGVVAENADEVIVMYAGSEVENASVYSLFDNPAHPYTQALFSARLDHCERKQRLATISGYVPRITELPTGCRFHPRCKYAMNLCQKGLVPNFSLKEKGHTTKCWLYDQELDSKIAYEENP